MIINIFIDNYNFKCLMFITEDEKTKGLAGVSHLKEDEGALFVFIPSRTVKFWMKGCLIPLDLVTIDDNFKVVDVYEMPVDDGRMIYTSTKKVCYCVELPYGTCKKLGICKGSKFGFCF